MIVLRWQDVTKDMKEKEGVTSEGQFGWMNSENRYYKYNVPTCSASAVNELEALVLGSARTDCQTPSQTT